MSWFQGSIQAAVDQCKKNDGLMIIFVRDQSQISASVAEAFADKETLDLLVNILQNRHSQTILLRIDHGTQDYNNLHSIYPVTSVPIVHFIDSRGFLLFSAKAENLESLLTGLKEGIETWLKERKPDVSSEPPFREQFQSQTSGDSTPPVAMNADTQVRDAVPPAEGIQDRVAYAQKRAAEIREKKEKEAREAEKQKEIQDRLDKKLALDAERTRMDRLAEQTRKELDKEKREEEAHRKKVLEQLKQDREARAAKDAAAKSVPAATTTESTATPSTSSTDYSRSRIQFRLDSGDGVKSFVGDFEALDALGTAMDYVWKETGIKNFTLVRLYPKREFGMDDAGTTLRYLGLVPNAVLMVIPAGGPIRRSGTGQSPGFFDALMDGLKFVLQLPIQWLIYIFAMFVHRPAVEAGGDGNRQPGPSPSGSAEKQKRGDLRQRRDPDDATYNGNSTQQL